VRDNLLTTIPNSFKALYNGGGRELLLRLEEDEEGEEDEEEEEMLLSSDDIVDSRTKSAKRMLERSSKICFFLSLL
jgi:hypothetical protein